MAVPGAVAVPPGRLLFVALIVVVVVVASVDCVCLSFSRVFHLFYLPRLSNMPAAATGWRHLPFAQLWLAAASIASHAAGSQQRRQQQRQQQQQQ